MSPSKDPQRPFQLKNWTRVSLATVGIILFFISLIGPWLLRSYTSSPALLWASLAIGSLVSFGAAIIGRLPAGFEIGGLDLTFPQAELSDFISTLRNSIDDPDVLARLMSQLQDAVGAQSFQRANRTANSKYGSGAPEITGTNSVDTSNNGTPPETSTATPQVELRSTTRLKNFLEGLSDTGQIESDYVVTTGERGNPPRFDFAVNVSGRTLVVERERYWNPTVLQLVTRRIERTLTHGAIDGAVVFCPNRGVPAFRDAIGGPRVLIVPVDESTDLAAGRIRQFASQLRAA